MSSLIRILHLEDNNNDAESIREKLGDEGVVCETVRVETREDFISAVEHGGFDLVLAGYKLPFFDGLSALAICKEKCPDIPFLFVSDLIGEDRAIECLKSGATDYVIKANLSRLAPAVRRALNEAKNRVTRRRAEEELGKLNRILQAKSRSSKAMMRARDELGYLNEVCRIIIADCGYALVWIGYAQNDEGKTVRPVAHAGLDEGYLEYLKVTWDDVERGRGPVGTAIRTCKPVVARNILTTPGFAPWRDEALKRGYASMIGVPLQKDGKAFGSLNIYSREQDPFSDDEMILLFDLAADLSYGIEAIRLRTAQDEAETALRESESRFRSLFENMLEGFAYCRMLFENDVPRDFIYLNVNNAFEKLTGLKNVIGKKVTEVIPGIRESLPELFTIYGRVALTGNRERLETFSESFGGWLSVSVYSTEKGYFVAVFDNITERKQAEELRSDAEARYRLLFQLSPEGIVILDPVTARPLEFNEAAHRQLGYSREEFAQLSLGDVEAEETAKETKSRIAGVIQNGKADFETRHRTRQGEIRYVHVTAQIVDIQGHPVYHCIWRDITEHRKLEEQLLHAQKMEAIGTLAGGVAHDFNNILNVIMGYAGLVLDKMKPDNSSREQMHEVLAAAERAATLTKQLLLFSRKQVVEVKPVDVKDIIAGIQKMLSRVIGEDIDLQIDFAGRSLTVMADAGQIEQVLVNMATNARDAMPKGGHLTITTETAQMDNAYVAAYGYGKPGMYAVITVADTGKGMDAETQAKIFEPFFTTKKIGEGTGFGLAISYGIVKQHNGYIKCSSEAGKGSVFKIYLPLVDDTAASGAKTEAPGGVKGGTETILVAEDDPSLRKLARIVLESFGYEVITAENGEDAVAKFIENRDRIKLVILDLVMPKKSGKEAYKEIKQMSPGIRAFFLSGYTMDMINSMEVERGIEVLHKPVVPNDLLRMVREVLDK